MTTISYLKSEAKAFIKRKNGHDEVIKVIPGSVHQDSTLCYELYIAFEDHPDYLGRILFDTSGYWIYDGETLPIAEQEQLADFIINYVERL